MDYQALKDEIQNDPEALGYAQNLPDDHVTVAVLLNGDDPAGATFYEDVPAEKAARIAVEVGCYAAIADDAEDPDSATRNISMATIDTFRKSNGTFAMRLPSLRQSLTALVNNDVLTQEQEQAFLDASLRPARRAEVVLGRGVTVTSQNVTKALQ